MLAALNTGHEGGCGTLHANSAEDVPARFEALGVAAGLPRDAVHAQLYAAFRVVVHLRRGGNGLRRLAEIAVLRRSTAGLVVAETAVRFAADRSATAGQGAARLESLLAARSP